MHTHTRLRASVRFGTPAPTVSRHSHHWMSNEALPPDATASARQRLASRLFPASLSQIPKRLSHYPTRASATATARATTSRSRPHSSASHPPLPH